MTKKTNTTPKTTKKTIAQQLAVDEKIIAQDKKRLANDKVAIATAQERITDLTIGEDVRNAVLIVSVLLNLFILIAWVTMQVTTKYDYAVSALVFGR